MIDKKIVRLRNGSPICFIMNMITNQIGRHKVLLSINCDYNKIQERSKKRTFWDENTFHPEMSGKEHI